jgi:hypothetical protein
VETDSPGTEDEDDRLRIRAKIASIVARDVFGLTASEMEYVLTDFPTLTNRQVRPTAAIAQGAKEILRSNCWSRLTNCAVVSRSGNLFPIAPLKGQKAF